MEAIQNYSRRDFVKTIGLASGGLLLAANSSLFASESTSTIETFNPNLFVYLQTDGTLTLIASRSEMGNGVRTSLPSIIADEMEADWSKVVVQQALMAIKILMALEVSYTFMTLCEKWALQPRLYSLLLPLKNGTFLKQNVSLNIILLYTVVVKN